MGPSLKSHYDPSAHAEGTDRNSLSLYSVIYCDAPIISSSAKPCSRINQRQRIERGLVRAFVKKLRQRFFFRTTNIHRLAIDDLRDVRALIVHVADQNCLRRTNNNTGRLEPDIDAMRAEVTFLSRMIVRINKDRIVRTRRHAGFAANADRLVEIDDAVRPFEHRGRRTRGHAWRMRALIAARHLVRAANLREDTDVDVLDVRAGHADRHDIFRLARRGARMTTDAASVVDDLRPLHATVASWLLLDHG